MAGWFPGLQRCSGVEALQEGWAGKMKGGVALLHEKAARVHGALPGNC